MRKNFRHLKHCLKRNLQRLKNDFYMTKNTGYLRFALKNRRKKTPNESGFSHFSYSGSIIRRC